MSEYQGMRWFKCDLHMQTPADSPRWQGQGMAAGETGLREAAEQYIRRCYETGRHVIGITDHNFASKDFIPFLCDAIKKISVEFGYEITLFPGFEFQADVGKGCHVLALFDPGIELDKIDHILTECGVAYPRFQGGRPKSSVKRLPDILEIIQRKDKSGRFQGIVMLPHCQGDSGIFDNDKISDWLQQEEFTNPELYCVEVPKPPRDMSSGWQKLFNSGVDCISGWRRESPVACIMSSDAKALKPEDGAENYIGFRHTWIEMSRPSIESLRQAFLDHDSRIRLQPGSPAKDYPHGHIASLSIRNAAFLKDQDIRFSPNLNCLIGGRGTGKSTVLEYIRFGVRQEDEALAKVQVERIRKTLRPDSGINIGWESSDGLEDRFEYRPGFGKSGIVGREVGEPSTVFGNLGIQILSQRQLNEIASLDENGHPSFLLPLIDDLCGNELAELKKRENEIRERLTSIFQQQRVFERLQQEYNTLKQEVTELNRQMGAIAAVQEEGKRYRYAQEAERYLKRVISHANETEERLNEIADEYPDAFSPIGSVVENWPFTSYFKKLEQEIEGAISDLWSNIRLAGHNYHLKIQTLTEKNEQWAEVTEAIRKAEQDFIDACAKQGLNPQDIERIRDIDSQKRSKTNELEQKETFKKQVENSVKGFDELLKELHSIWKSQTKRREDDIREILSGKGIRQVPVDPGRPDGKKRPFIEIVISSSGDNSHFKKQWNEVRPKDGRSKLGREWPDIADVLFEKFLAAGEEIGSPWEVLLNWFNDPHDAPDEVKEHIEPLRNHLLKENRDVWEKLRLSRNKDSVDLILYRQDGRRAGSLREGGLSDGQRNTAVLSLLLAKGAGPVLIDQPEDELDSNFIYEELVPLLRHIKEHRQVILVTHNANLPVNGDAEFVYALKAEEGRGIKYAEGGLDREEVKDAVLEIMEGSEEAFRKRREKYHF